MMLEVRCCCNPDKLLGYLPEPTSGTAETFAVRSTPVWAMSGPPISEVPEVVRLEVHQMAYAQIAEDGLNVVERVWPCYKAEGIPVETLEQIPTFLRARR